MNQVHSAPGRATDRPTAQHHRLRIYLENICPVHTRLFPNYERRYFVCLSRAIIFLTVNGILKPRQYERYCRIKFVTPTLMMILYQFTEFSTRCDVSGRRLSEAPVGMGDQDLSMIGLLSELMPPPCFLLSLPHEPTTYHSK